MPRPLPGISAAQRTEARRRVLQLLKEKFPHAYRDLYAHHKKISGGNRSAACRLASAQLAVEYPAHYEHLLGVELAAVLSNRQDR